MREETKIAYEEADKWIEKVSEKFSGERRLELIKNEDYNQ